MRKEYSIKKKTVIAALSVVVVCLTGGLMYCVNSMADMQPSYTSKNPSINDIEFEVENEITSIPSNTIKEVDIVINNTDVAVPINEDVKVKPSEGKPKSPSEVIPPKEKPQDKSLEVPVQNPNDDGICQPVHEPQPEVAQHQDSEKQSEGAIYIEGFGWVEDSGEDNQTMVAPNAGTGDIVGEM